MSLEILGRRFVTFGVEMTITTRLILVVTFLDSNRLFDQRLGLADPPVLHVASCFDPVSQRTQTRQCQSTRPFQLGLSCPPIPEEEHIHMMLVYLCYLERLNDHICALNMEQFRTMIGNRRKRLAYV